MHIASMSLGIFDFLIEWIANLVGTVIGWFFDIVMQIVNRLVFSIAKQILFIVDAIQALFRRLAGLDRYWMVEGGQTVEKEGDILISLMRNETVLEVFITLTLVAVAMVIIATIIKVVQSEFTTEGSKNSKGGIIGQAIKSFIMFMLVPVLCFGGVLVSNALLKALDGATSKGGSDSMASHIFVSASSSANRARNGDISPTGDLAKFLSGTVDTNGKHTNGNGYKSSAQFANAIDDAFRNKRYFGQNQPSSGSGVVQTIINSIFSVAVGGIGGAVMEAGTGSVYGVTTYENIYMVGTYYDIGQMNMIILIGGSIMACYVMLVTSFGLVMRLFKAAILFMISPPVIAIAPLDKGNAFQSWRKQFVSEVLAGYGAIIGLNLFFIILPILNNINLFPDFSTGSLGAIPGVEGNTTVGGFGGNIYNDLAHLLFTIVGLYMMKDLIKMIGDIAGGSDAMGAGEGMAKKAVGTAAKVGVAAAGIATGGAALLASKGAAIGAAKFGGMANKMTKKGGSLSGIFKDGKLKEGMVGEDGKLTQAALDTGATDADFAQYNEYREKEAKRAAVRDSGVKFAKNNLASTLGRAAKVINSKTGLKLNEGMTAKERKDNAEKIAEADANAIMDGDASVGQLIKGTAFGKHVLRSGAKDKVTEQRDALKAGTDRGDSDAVKKAKEDSYNAMKELKTNSSDPTKLISEIAKHVNNEHEGEISQQIWRGMDDTLKRLLDAMNRQKSANGNVSIAQAKLDVARASGDSNAIGVAEAELKAAKTNRSSINSEVTQLRSSFESQRQAAEIKLKDVNVQSKIEAEVRAKFANSAPQSADAVKKAVEQAVKNNGVDKNDINAMTDKILKKFMEEISKVAPK